MESLRSLPEGPSYIGREGRAEAAVSRRGDTVFVVARCDSLQQLNYRLHEQIGRLTQRREADETERTPATLPFWERIKVLLWGIATGIILTTVTKSIYTRCQNKR